MSFRLASSTAARVELCLIDQAPDGGLIRQPSRVLALSRGEDGVFSVFVPGARAGQLYGYRVHGPWAPARGLRFDPRCLLLDPRARAVTGALDWRAAEARPGDPAARPLAVVVDEGFDWSGDQRPGTPWADTVIYEVHVKGFTARHPAVDPALRGTYLGLASPPAIAHLQRLGVTAVELLPVQEMVDERALWSRGARNYWGYNPVAHFAPAGRYAATGTRGQQVREFKTLVKALHAAGIEVILDVVFNHTAEGDHRGPTLSLRGIDNPGYYALDPRAPGRYLDFSGCGNTLDPRRPLARALVHECLRYWVRELRVDGFRFDLAPTLARGDHGFDPRAELLRALSHDPELAGIKLIAEPWDVGPGGYNLGGFPAPWAEWNDRYRDDVRRFWRGDEGLAGALATRLSGSSDLFAGVDADGVARGPTASVNFVTAHDGFTLRDLVSYARKHNLDNGEQNRDGHHENFSANHGVEGPTDDPAITAARARQRRNLWATLLLSQGVPMLSAGDELGRTQHGNNNAYCHDSPLSWLDWTLDADADAFLRFASGLVTLRRAHPVLRRRAFLTGAPQLGADEPDVVWMHPEGRAMAPEDWSGARCFGFTLSSEGPERGRAGEGGARSLMVLVNGEPRSRLFRILGRAEEWRVCVDTATGEVLEAPGRQAASEPRWVDGCCPLAPQSVVVLCRLDAPRLRRGAREEAS